jgi:predicted Zn-dependent peptidase
LRHLALALLLTLVASAGQAAAATVTRHVLPNGLVVLVREDASVGVMGASLMVRGGTLFEAPDEAGITNFMHRVMLRGTRRYDAVRLTQAIEDLGGSLDASGDVEFAEVRGTALGRNWEALLTLMAEVALHPTFPADEVERERRLIVSAIQSRGDTPFQRAFDAMLADLYGRHGYGWPSVGMRESLTRLDRGALQARYTALYRPDRMVLAVSGQVPRDRVVRAAEKLFRSMPAPTSAAPTAPSPAPPRRARDLVERPAQQAQVMVGYIAPGLADPDYAAVRVMGMLLGGGMSGRLFAELRDRRGLAYQVGVLGSYRTGPSFLLAYMGTAPANVDASEKGVLAEIERIRTEPVTDRELARAKAYLLGNLTMDRRTTARDAWYLAFFEVTGAGWGFPESYAKAVEAVTTADIGRVAQRYLTGPTVVVLQPPPKGVGR